MFARCSLRYHVDRFRLEIVQNHKVHSKVTLINSPWIIFPNQLSNRYWNSLLCCSPSLDKKHLIDIYHALYTLMGNNVLLQTYDFVIHSPGSICITTKHCSGDFLVGRIPIVPTEQAVTWLFDNTPFSGSFTIKYLSLQSQHFMISPQVQGMFGVREFPEYSKRSWLMTVYSLFAQASQLSLSPSQNLRDIDYRMHNMEYVKVLCPWPPTIILCINPCYAHDPFQLLDTFMADSDYAAFALSLTVCEPLLNPESNIVSWPVIHLYCDLDLSNEISMEEAEALFGIKVCFGTHRDMYQVLKKQLSTIVEINTMCGFDPALKGADICEYFDLACIEIFENPVKSPPGKLIFGIL
ncbi:hypothetical protein ARMGADRAFT_669231 [Armillaria gallica]|uniref:Uncharacterized protein n=1 Tax=Armillaria gallica TaxID=47427 RepID=A0A2H3CK62_ARMGA|nr:hypothetical protein ARMGADRAFT_669231 [Armillaria gallica]